MTTRATGDAAEAAAAAHLRANGLTILAASWTLQGGRGGELDLVAFDPRAKLLVFAEVKARQSQTASAEAAVAAITPTKRQRVEHTARVYMQANASQREVASAKGVRFDALGVAIREDGTFEVAWLADAWRPGE
jgi:putative endonuclease